MAWCGIKCKWVARQAMQVSTWRGLALIAGALGLVVNPAQLELILSGVGLVLGGAEVLRDESDS